MSRPLENASLRVPNSHLWLGSAVVAAYAGCLVVASLVAVSVGNDTIVVDHAIWLRLTLALASVILLTGAWAGAWRSRKTHRPRERIRWLRRRLGHSELVSAAVDPRIDETVAGTDPEQDRDAQIRAWVTDFYDRYDNWELSKTARIAFLPGRYVHRAIQTVTQSQLSTTHKVTREVRIPGASSSRVCRVIVPVLTLPKGSMVDGLDIECDGANEIGRAHV